MAAITAGMVGELRAKTDAPMMECKKALVEAEGDIGKAEEILRVRLGNKASKASSRVTAEGLIVVAIQEKVAVMVEVNCETDFVAKNDDFIAFSQNIANLIIEKNPVDVAAIANLSMADGTVESVRTALVGKIGENLSIRRFQRIESQNQLTSYVHNGRIGVLVEYTGNEEAGKDTALHIAAMKPAALSSAEVDAELVAKERSIAKQKAAETGKPTEIIAKMVEGAVQKYLKEVSLLNQPFVKNDKLTIEQMLKEKNTTVHRFAMMIMGEGIEKRQDDFAADVAAQMAAAKSGT